MEILEKLSKEQENVNKIREQLFSVKKVQLHPNIEGFESPNSWGVYKTTGGAPLGTVGKDFLPTDQEQVLDSLLQGLIDSDLDTSKLQFKTFKEDRKIMFKVPIKAFKFTNLAGKEDETILYLNFMTGYDGGTRNSLFVSSYRLICKNGMKATVTEFTSKFKNTTGNIGKVEAMTPEIIRVLNNADNYQEMLQKLNKVEVSKRQVDYFIEKVFNMKRSDYSEWSKRKQNIFDSINRSVGLEIERTGQTAFGLLNGVTHWTNHVASTNNREDYVFVDTGAWYNKRAEQYLVKNMIN